VGDGIPNNSKYDCWQIKTVLDSTVKCSAQVPSTPLCRLSVVTPRGPGTGAEYCGELVCLSVCLRPIFASFFPHVIYLWPWLGPTLAAQ